MENLAEDFTGNSMKRHLKEYVLDRFEGSYAILEDKYGKTYDVLRDELPDNTHEGDVLNENNGTYLFDKKATDIKRAKLQRISDSLSNNE